ncbi:MAG: cytochrome b [Methyloversatilis sp.]|jgi:cytochrome b561|uniref:cytochrome b n=1 Tax=Methyloversatilis TaxID=378210 RepID=UPI00035C3F3B|nr:MULTISPECIES: cytochrome b [Methyloversatilis]MCR6666896.1 cytochrome b [Methyloversatilis sp.]PZU54226.1 MAG: cytochrome b [Thauera sp.]
MRYTRTAMSLHWLIALMLFGMFGFGLYMVELPLSPQKLKFYSYHKWAGVTVFLLVLARLAWRITHRPPALPAGMPAWQVKAAKAGHHLLYLLMVIVPLSGWLMSSAKGFQTVWFGVLPLPDLLAKDEALGEALLLTHRLLNWFFMLVVAGHVVAALKHHFIDRDGLLSRMLPGR